MKKFYTLLVAAFIGFVGNAQIVNIPDAAFKAKLLASRTTNSIAQDLSGAYFKIDANGDGEIQETEAQQVSFISIGNASIPCSSNCVTSLEGINRFTNLTELYCNGNSLTSIDINGLANFQKLSCDSNQITSINITGATDFFGLYCPDNRLTSLNVSQLNNLHYL